MVSTAAAVSASPAAPVDRARMDTGSDRDRCALDHQSRVRILGGPALLKGVEPKSAAIEKCKHAGIGRDQKSSIRFH